jgi:hypothetical protein
MQDNSHRATTRRARQNSRVLPTFEAGRKRPIRSDTGSQDCAMQSISHRATRPRCSHSWHGPSVSSADPRFGHPLSQWSCPNWQWRVLRRQGTTPPRQYSWNAATCGTSIFRWRRPMPRLCRYRRPSQSRAIWRPCDELDEAPRSVQLMREFPRPGFISPNLSLVIADRQAVSLRRPSHNPEWTLLRRKSMDLASRVHIPNARDSNPRALSRGRCEVRAIGRQCRRVHPSTFLRLRAKRIPGDRRKQDRDSRHQHPGTSAAGAQPRHSMQLPGLWRGRNFDRVRLFRFTAACVHKFV